MAGLVLKGTLDFRGTVKLNPSGGKVKVGTAEVLVDKASGTASPVLVPPTSPIKPGPEVKVLVSLNQRVTAGGKNILTQGMCLQDTVWPGFVMRGSSKVTVNGVPMNVKDDKATIFPSGGSATLSTSGQ